MKGRACVRIAHDMLKKKHSVWIPIGLLVALLTPHTKADFSALVPNLADYEIVPVRAGSASPAADFTDAILQEYGLLSFSPWRIRPGDAVLEVYEMDDTQAAYGIFSIWEVEQREQGNSLPIGIENLRLGNRVAFWRGHYFFVLSCTAASHDLLTVFPPRLKKAIDERNLHPASVFQLPDRNLIRSSIRFYLGQEAMARNPIIPAQLISHLGFEDAAEAALAGYEPHGFPLLLLAYPTASVAAAYAVKIQDALQSVVSKDGIYMKRSGPLLGLFLGPLPAATKVLGDLQYKATVEWVYEKDALLLQMERGRGEIVTFLGVITQSIVSTGVLFLVVLVLGFAAGLLRVVLIRSVPSFGHRGETIFLDLKGRSG